MEMKEKQYQTCLDTMEKQGKVSLGIMSNDSWIRDPKRFFFTLSRYKFVSKMLSGTPTVAEVGCSDAFASRIVAQSVRSLTVTDFDPVFIEDARLHNVPPFECKIQQHDILTGPLSDRYDAVYSLDVLEHIAADQEQIFMKNIKDSLKEHGICMIGSPSLNSQQYASPISREGHVNCKGYSELKNLLERYFRHVFIFSMNDEVVHTGYSEMAHYFMALCTEPRD